MGKVTVGILALELCWTCPTIFVFPEDEDIPAVPLSNEGSAGRNNTLDEVVPGNTSSGFYNRLLGLVEVEAAAENLEVEIPKRTSGMFKFASLFVF